jgi:hypothetical protein
MLVYQMRNSAGAWESGGANPDMERKKYTQAAERQ